MSDNKTGLGHQLFHDRKCVDACKSSLEQAYKDLNDMNDGRFEISVIPMLVKINILIKQCSDLSLSMDEAINLNT